MAMAMNLDFMTKTKQLGSWVSDKGVKKKQSLYSCLQRHWVVTQVDKWTWVPMKSSS